jgi:hypothetical protein
MCFLHMCFLLCRRVVEQGLHSDSPFSSIFVLSFLRPQLEMRMEMNGGRYTTVTSWVHNTLDNLCIWALLGSSCFWMFLAVL